MKRNTAGSSIPIDVRRRQLSATLKTLIHDVETFDAIHGIGHPLGPEAFLQLGRHMLIVDPSGMAGFKVFGSDNHGGIVVELSNDAKRSEAAPIPSGIGGRAPHRAYTKGQGNHSARRAVPFFAFHPR